MANATTTTIYIIPIVNRHQYIYIYISTFETECTAFFVLNSQNQFACMFVVKVIIIIIIIIIIKFNNEIYAMLSFVDACVYLQKNGSLLLHFGTYINLHIVQFVTL